MEKSANCSNCGSPLREGKKYCERCGTSLIDLRALMRSMQANEILLSKPISPSPSSEPQVLASAEHDLDHGQQDPNMLTISLKGGLAAAGVFFVIIGFMSFIVLFGMSVPDENAVAVSSLCHTWISTSILKDGAPQKVDSLSLTFNPDGSYRAFLDMPTDQGQVIHGKWTVFEGKLKLDPRLLPIGSSYVQADFTVGDGEESLLIFYKFSKSSYHLEFKVFDGKAS